MYRLSRVHAVSPIVCFVAGATIGPPAAARYYGALALASISCHCAAGRATTNGDDDPGLGQFFNMISLWIAQASAAAETPREGGEGWLLDPELVDPGYTQTMAGDTIQTAFPPPPPTPETPGWLMAIGRGIRSLFEFLTPAAQPLMWVAGILLVLLLLYLFVPAFATWVDDLRLRRKRGTAADEEDMVGQAEAGAARALLAEADALAAAGRFAEAAHLLLYRSVEDIEGRRPGLVKPAMTSRELAAATDLPAVAREAFSRIARAVEISLFGGRAIDAGGWEQCRSAYAEMTVPKNWARA